MIRNLLVTHDRYPNSNMFCLFVCFVLAKKKKKKREKRPQKRLIWSCNWEVPKYVGFR